MKKFIFTIVLLILCAAVVFAQGQENTPKAQLLWEKTFEDVRTIDAWFTENDEVIVRIDQTVERKFALDGEEIGAARAYERSDNLLLSANNGKTKVIKRITNENDWGETSIEKVLITSSGKEILLGDEVAKIRLAPNGEYIVVFPYVHEMEEIPFEYSNEVKVFDLEGNNLLKYPIPPSVKLWRLEFSPNSEYFTIYNSVNKVWFFTPNNLLWYKEIIIEESYCTISDIAVANDGSNVILSMLPNNQITYFDRTGTIKWKITALYNEVYGVVSWDNSILCTFPGGDKKGFLYDAMTGNFIDHIQTAKDINRIGELDFNLSASGRYLLIKGLELKSHYPGYLALYDILNVINGGK